MLPPGTHPSGRFWGNPNILVKMTSLLPEIWMSLILHHLAGLVRVANGDLTTWIRVQKSCMGLGFENKWCIKFGTALRLHKNGLSVNVLN